MTRTQSSERLQHLLQLQMKLLEYEAWYCRAGLGQSRTGQGRTVQGRTVLGRAELGRAALSVICKRQLMTYICGRVYV